MPLIRDYCYGNIERRKKLEVAYICKTKHSVWGKPHCFTPDPSSSSSFFCCKRLFFSFPFSGSSRKNIDVRSLSLALFSNVYSLGFLFRALGFLMRKKSCFVVVVAQFGVHSWLQFLLFLVASLCGEFLFSSQKTFLARSWDHDTFSKYLPRGPCCLIFSLSIKEWRDHCTSHTFLSFYEERMRRPNFFLRELQFRASLFFCLPRDPHTQVNLFNLSLFLSSFLRVVSFLSSRPEKQKFYWKIGSDQDCSVCKEKRVEFLSLFFISLFFPFFSL